MDIPSIQQLRYYLATPKVERDAKQLQELHWKATVMVDELQQKLDALQPAPDPPTIDEHLPRKAKPPKD